MFITKFCAQLPQSNAVGNMGYKIHSIQLAPTYYRNANLLVVTKSGVQILMDIKENESRIVSVLHPPNYSMFES